MAVFCRKISNLVDNTKTLSLIVFNHAMFYMTQNMTKTSVLPLLSCLTQPVIYGYVDQEAKIEGECAPPPLHTHTLTHTHTSWMGSWGDSERRRLFWIKYCCPHSFSIVRCVTTLLLAWHWSTFYSWLMNGDRHVLQKADDTRSLTDAEVLQIVVHDITILMDGQWLHYPDSRQWRQLNFDVNIRSMTSLSSHRSNMISSLLLTNFWKYSIWYYYKYPVLSELGTR